MKYLRLLFCNLFCVIVFSASFLLVFFVFAPSIGAGIEHNVSGWAWSENIGWVSVNSTNCVEANQQKAGACNAGVNYGVNIQDDGSIIGWAWSENSGWICWGETCQAYGKAPDGAEAKALIDLQTGQISGWFKFVGLGEEGWSKLSGQLYGAKLDLKEGAFSEFGWNASAFGQGIGWLSFSCKNQNICDKSNYQVITSWRWTEQPICVCDPWTITQQDCENGQKICVRECIPDQCKVEKTCVGQEGCTVSGDGVVGGDGVDTGGVDDGVDTVVCTCVNWGEWGECINGQQIRTRQCVNDCDTEEEEQSCEVPSDGDSVIQQLQSCCVDKKVTKCAVGAAAQSIGFCSSTRQECCEDNNCSFQETCGPWDMPWREIKDGSVYVGGNIYERLAPLGKYNVFYLIRATKEITQKWGEKIGWKSEQPREPEKQWISGYPINKPPEELNLVGEIGEQSLESWVGSIKSGEGVVVKEGDLEISGNEAPGVWVVKGNISIARNVTEITGTFFSTGTIYTGAGEQLTVHGSLAAVKGFSWQRTKGSLDRGSEQVIFDGRTLLNPPNGLVDKKKGLPIWREGVVSVGIGE